MKFWITASIGIVLVTAVTTAIYVLSPDLKAPAKSNKPKVTASEDAPIIRMPETHKEFVNLRQHEDHMAVFDVRNDGKTAATLMPDKPSCSCTSATFQREGGPEEVTLSLGPGESCKYLVRWNTRGALGTHTVQAPILSSDPRRSRIGVQVTFSVRWGFELSPSEPNFGLIAEGQSASKTVFVYSTVLEDFQVLEATSSSGWLKVSAEPATAEELSKLGGKSGSKLELRLEGALPVGFLQDTVDFKSTIDPKRQNSFPVSGKVEGSIRAIPSSVHFKVVREGSDRTHRVEIFAGTLPPRRYLKVAKVEPPFLQTKLEHDRDPDQQARWLLTVTVAEGAPPGEFVGMIQITDDQDTPKLNLTTAGTIDGSDRITNAAAP